MHDSRGWQRITCEERDEHLKLMGDHARVLSSLTDLYGEFGDPLIFTEWGRDDVDEPIFKEFRYPPLDGEGPDRAPCEHWFWVGENDALTETGDKTP